MSYRNLQQTLKQLRSNGAILTCKLNAKHAVLQAEYDRLTEGTQTEVDQLPANVDNEVATSTTKKLPLPAVVLIVLALIAGATIVASVHLIALLIVVCRTVLEKLRTLQPVPMLPDLS